MKTVVLNGIRVVELGLWVAGPASAGLLADFGAEVIKIEPPTGDPMRWFFRLTAGSKVDKNPPFELDNRGKRSVVIDLRDARGRDAAYRIIADADVFVTNMRPDALGRIGFDPGTLRERFPALIYASVTGYGRTGADSNRSGYDLGAFWARSGVAETLTVAGDAPPNLRGGFGDHVTALATVNGILAALIERGRTGKGRVVETSLLRTGMYCLGWDLNIQLEFGKTREPIPREASETPLLNSYRASDAKWFWLLGVEADRHFPGIMKSIGREDLIDDPRFADARDRRHNRAEFIAILDAAFAEHPSSHWHRRFDAEDVWWAPVQSPAEVVADEQAHAAGAIVEAMRSDGTKKRVIASPVGYEGEPKLMKPPPALGADTEAVLSRAGLTSTEIGELRTLELIPKS